MKKIVHELKIAELGDGYTIFRYMFEMFHGR